MSRQPSRAPAYKKHPTRDTARCWVGGRAGGYVCLGKFNSPESLEAYRRVCAEVAAAGPAAPVAPAGASVNEVCLAFITHAEGFYVRRDGTQTTEVDEFRQAIKILRSLYGTTPAREFGPKALKAVRQHMIAVNKWCRARVNAQSRRVRRMFKWAASEELVPADVWVALGTVAGLRKNRSEAYEPDPVVPVPQADYLATLPHLVPTLRAMCQLNRLSGLRPGEVRLLTPADLDRSAEQWVFVPDEHKMEYKGIKKAIPLSASARAVIEPRLAGLGPDDLVFSPEAAVAELNAQKRARRKSKVPPSQLDRRKPEAAKVRHVPPAFTIQGYAQYVARGCKRAGVKPWKPGQLRHTFGTEVRERFGLEVAQVLLGHTHAKTTEIYAEAALAKAAAAARELG